MVAPRVAPRRDEEDELTRWVRNRDVLAIEQWAAGGADRKLDVLLRAAELDALADLLPVLLGANRPYMVPFENVVVEDGPFLMKRALCCRSRQSVAYLLRVRHIFPDEEDLLAVGCGVDLWAEEDLAAKLSWDFIEWLVDELRPYALAPENASDMFVGLSISAWDQVGGDNFVVHVRHIMGLLDVHPRSPLMVTLFDHLMDVLLERGEEYPLDFMIAFLAAFPHSAAQNATILGAVLSSDEIQWMDDRPEDAMDYAVELLLRHGAIPQGVLVPAVELQNEAVLRRLLQADVDPMGDDAREALDAAQRSGWLVGQNMIRLAQIDARRRQRR